MTDLLNNLDQTTLFAIIGGILLLFFPQLKDLIGPLFSSSCTQCEQENQTRLHHWQKLLEACENLDNSRLKEKLEDLPSLFITSTSGAEGEEKT